MSGSYIDVPDAAGGRRYQKYAFHFAPEVFTCKARPVSESYAPETVCDDNRASGAIGHRLVKHIHPFRAIRRHASASQHLKYTKSIYY